MEQTTVNGTLDSWEGFLGSNFLNADDVKTESDIFVVINVELDDENKVMATMERNEISYKYSLNVTNSNFLKDAGVKSPKDLIGKKITFSKVRVMSPKTKKEVDSLRIKSVE